MSVNMIAASLRCSMSALIRDGCCNAAAQRKSYRSSFRSGVKFSHRNDFLRERFETRIAAQVIEQRIDSNVVDVVPIVLTISTLQLIHGVALIPQSKKDGCDTVSGHIA